MKIELQPKGHKSTKVVEELIQIVQGEPKIEFEVFDYRSMGIVETLLITIVGTTVGNVLSIFVNELLRKTKENNLTTILIIEEDKLLFNLPEESDKLQDYIDKGTNGN